MYTKLLKLCGYEPEEIERERPRIDRAFQILEIGPEDIDRAQGRIVQFFDTELLGVRKLLGIWMKRLINLVLAKEEGKTVIYTNWPPIPQVTSAMSLISADVLCESMEVVVLVVMGQIFGKIDPILEAAEESGLPPGEGHCSLLQTRLGAIAKGIVPVSDIALSSGHLCDQAPKTDELIHEVYGVRNIFLDNCLDSSWDEFPEITPRRIGYFASEIKAALREFQEVTGMKLSDSHLRRATLWVIKLCTAFEDILELMKADPQPVSQVDLGLYWWAIIAPESVTFGEGLQAMSTLAREARERVDKGLGVVEKGAPKVVISIHHATDPSIVQMIEDVGLSVPAVASFWLTPLLRLKSKYTSFEERIAEAVLRQGIVHSPAGWISSYEECCKAFNADGFLNFYPFSCRPWAITPLMQNEAIERDLGIPVMTLEMDPCDTRQYRAELLKTRVEAFAEVVKAAKAARAA